MVSLQDGTWVQPYMLKGGTTFEEINPVVAANVTFPSMLRKEAQSIIKKAFDDKINTDSVWPRNPTTMDELANVTIRAEQQFEISLLSKFFADRASVRVWTEKSQNVH